MATEAKCIRLFYWEYSSCW